MYHTKIPNSFLLSNYFDQRNDPNQAKSTVFLISQNTSSELPTINEISHFAVRLLRGQCNTGMK